MFVDGFCFNRSLFQIARCNYSEVLTEVLVSWEENFDKLRLPRDDSAVVLSAPKVR